MAGRRCANAKCGAQEERIVKGNQEYLNIDPISGLCLGCLVQRTRDAMPTLETAPADFKKAQSGDAD